MVTPSARAKLQRFLRQQDRQAYIAKGRELLNQRLKELGLPTLGSAGDKISKSLSKEELENKLMLIAQGQLSITRFLRQFWQKEMEKMEQLKLQQQAVKDEISQDLERIKNEVVIDFDKTKLNYEFCHACSPKVGDRIVAKVSRQSIKIHKLSCKALQSVNYEHLLEAHWE